MSYLSLLQKIKDISLEQHDLQWLTSYLSDVVVDGATSNASPVLSGVPCIRIGFRPVFYFLCTSTVCPWCHDLHEGSKISMYADDILLSKPINHPDNYNDLQRDIDAI